LYLGDTGLLPLDRSQDVSAVNIARLPVGIEPQAIEAGPMDAIRIWWASGGRLNWTLASPSGSANQCAVGERALCVGIGELSTYRSLTVARPQVGPWLAGQFQN